MCVFSKRRESFFGKNLKNIYGEPLKQCRKYKGDQRGSWDVEGYCSEQGVDTGLHQICFNLNDNTKNFRAILGKVTGLLLEYLKEKETIIIVCV